LFFPYLTEVIASTDVGFITKLGLLSTVDVLPPSTICALPLILHTEELSGNCWKTKFPCLPTAPGLLGPALLPLLPPRLPPAPPLPPCPADPRYPLLVVLLLRHNHRQKMIRQLIPNLRLEILWYNMILINEIKREEAKKCLSQ